MCKFGNKNVDTLKLIYKSHKKEIPTLCRINDQNYGYNMGMGCADGVFFLYAIPLDTLPPFYFCIPYLQS